MEQNMSALEALLARSYGNLTGIVVQQDGVKRYEWYAPGYDAHHACHGFSVTKSVVSALVGIALERGFLKSVDQKVLAFFPEYTPPVGEESIQQITLRHLLTMTAPYKYETEPYVSFFASEDPSRDALDLLGGEKPIGAFHYSGIGGTHILSGILTRAVGRPLLEFAQEVLFGPLEMEVPCSVELHSQEEQIAVMGDRNTRGWVVDPKGNHWASWGLFLRPEDMVKIGQLYWNGGKWHGRQVVPAYWVEESTRVQSRWGELGYGYLWWIIDETGPCYAALGDGGNAIYVNAAKGLVVIVAGTFTPEARDSVELIRNHIEPLLEEEPV